jgi:hypothetical protein
VTPEDSSHDDTSAWRLPLVRAARHTLRQHRLVAIGCATVLATAALGATAFATDTSGSSGKAPVAAPVPVGATSATPAASAKPSPSATPSSKKATPSPVATKTTAKATQSATSTTSARPAQSVLTEAAGPVINDGPGNAAVAVLDLNTGASASYNGGSRFQTASIVKLDILSTLLLQCQQKNTSLTSAEKSLATTMIENSNNDSATSLYNDDGGAPAIDAANKIFGLTDTTVGTDGYWGLTETTAPDQLRLLENVFTGDSALTEIDRQYIQNLMSQVEPDQRWGVSAAASPGTSYMLKNGWLPNGDTNLWSINSIGEVQHSGHTYLVATLSDNEPTEDTGISHIENLAAKSVEALSGAGY